MSHKPTARRLSGLVNISEERRLWVKGCLVADESAYLELSFEEAPGKLPETNITYMRVWSGRTDWFEFQMGSLCKRPSIDHWTLIAPIIERLKAYRPIQVDIPYHIR